ncbi:MAG: hypothetical protein KKF68_00890 [Nanoarchaeota archaeon]|nr:hypothetical protein [Nanoarchaeota archaeon]
MEPPKFREVTSITFLGHYEPFVRDRLRRKGEEIIGNGEGETPGTVVLYTTRLDDKKSEFSKNE